MKYVLGIDLGTSGVKTVLFDASGRQSCEAAREYPLYQPQNGWAEQEPEDWYEGAAATQSALSHNPHDCARARSTSQRIWTTRPWEPHASRSSAAPQMIRGQSLVVTLCAPIDTD